jgi:hypothetical protein
MTHKRTNHNLSQYEGEKINIIEICYIMRCVPVDKRVVGDLRKSRPDGGIENRKGMCLTVISVNSNRQISAMLTSVLKTYSVGNKYSHNTR